MITEAFEEINSQKKEFFNYLNLYSASHENDIKLSNEQKSNCQTKKQTLHYLKSQTKPETYCLKCLRSGDLLMCDQCENTFHLICLGLTCVPTGQWLCSQCVLLNKTAPSNKEDWPNNLALVHSYVMLKTAKEEEKKRLMKILEEINEEKEAILTKTSALKETLLLKLHEKCELLETCNSAKKILGVMKAFVLLVQSSGTL